VLSEGVWFGEGIVVLALISFFKEAASAMKPFA